MNVHFHLKKPARGSSHTFPVPDMAHRHWEDLQLQHLPALDLEKHKYSP